MFAFVIGDPKGGKVLIRTLARGNVEANGKGIRNVSLLGSNEPIDWKQTDSGLELQFPAILPCEYAYGFKIEVNGQLDQSDRPPPTDGEPRVGDYPILTPPDWYPVRQ